MDLGPGGTGPGIVGVNDGMDCNVAVGGKLCKCAATGEVTGSEATGKLTVQTPGAARRRCFLSGDGD